MAHIEEKIEIQVFALKDISSDGNFHARVAYLSEVLFRAAESYVRRFGNIHNQTVRRVMVIVNAAGQLVGKHSEIQSYVPLQAALPFEVGVHH